MKPAHLARRALKPAVFILSLVPFGLLVRDGLWGDLGANPIEEITHRTGTWTLTFLLITLSVTPARRLPGLNRLIQVRRMLGLFAFFYASLHFLTYLALDQFFAFGAIIEDIAERPYITAGFTAFVLLIPLALTSTNAMIRRLGGKRWRRLHRLVYVAAAVGVLHFVWLTKADYRRPTIYAAVLLFLLGYRVWYRYRRSRRAGPTGTRGKRAPPEALNAP